MPKELRKRLDIKEQDPLSIYIDEENIILKKYKPDCIFCGDLKDIINFKEKDICTNCLNELKDAAI